MLSIMWISYRLLLLSITTKIFAIPFTHDQVVAIDLLNDSVISSNQNEISNSNVDFIDHETTTSISVTQNSKMIGLKRRDRAVCPVRKKTTQPPLSTIDFSKFNPLKKPLEKPAENMIEVQVDPCIGRHAADGLLQDNLLSCGGPKVGNVGLRSDFVLNCVIGQF